LGTQVAKLRFASRPRGVRSDPTPGVRPVFPAKRSLAAVRSQAELGNEGNGNEGTELGNEGTGEFALTALPAGPYLTR